MKVSRVLESVCSKYLLKAASSALLLPASRRLDMLQEINLNMKRAKESRSSNL